MDLKIANLINVDLISLDLASTRKDQVLSEMVSLLAKAGKVKDPDDFLKCVRERETMGSTGIGKGIAIPHAKSDAITEVAIAFGRSRGGIEFDAIDGIPVNLVFLLAAPRNTTGIYLKALAHLSRLLRHEKYREDLCGAADTAQVLAALTAGDVA